MGSIDSATNTTAAMDIDPAMQPWVKTPLKESSALSRAAGCRILLKLENLQPSGSFKSRGIGAYMLSRLSIAPDPTQTHFYCSSGGNAGLACVDAARRMGRPATVVVPSSTSPAMVARVRAAGAHEVVVHGANWAEADAHLRKDILAADAAGVYVPPFDDAAVWAGNAGLVDELNTQLNGEAPDAIICSVGGGGLLIGIVQGLAAAGWADVPVLAVETAGADSLAASLNAGKLITLPGITSIAKSLGATRVASRAYELAQRDAVRSVVLDDAEAAMGCWRLADDERLMVEPACGVSVALCYDGRLERALGRKLGPDSRVVVVVCGGNDVSVERLHELRGLYGPRVEKGLPHQGDVPSAQTAPVVV
ncbi:uncharacterized protein K452DRAFT_287456 [Aplosporella prunicola CBS 121167]|uniref:L-serine ammonia-lyase n=1 Tax=Aplosporella prunicola CBS 121167 TaxID=1176127 RepID=A0A6A6BDH5_9PEZI|nr:uncharacterized protein K452DRAFT_287456 [Aplosporella prunicola CBS 121167]KAF2142239.1 hypothetical protein K452DRAFT_287456 [Aplosporella prunicola CBS 121167]